MSDVKELYQKNPKGENKKRKRFFAHRQVSDSIPMALLLALTGGFLDAYTYVTRGGVFANAQTGNFALMALNLAYFRRIKRNILLMNPNIIGKVKQKKGKYLKHN